MEGRLQSDNSVWRADRAARVAQLLRHETSVPSSSVALRKLAFASVSAVVSASCAMSVPVRRDHRHRRRLALRRRPRALLEAHPERLQRDAHGDRVRRDALRRARSPRLFRRCPSTMRCELEPCSGALEGAERTAGSAALLARVAHRRHRRDRGLGGRRPARRRAGRRRARRQRRRAGSTSPSVSTSSSSPTAGSASRRTRFRSRSSACSRARFRSRSSCTASATSSRPGARARPTPFPTPRRSSGAAKRR